MEDGPINVADFERLAAEKLERGPLDYFAGGAGDEITLRENVEAWGHWRLRPRVLNDVREVSAATELLGKPVEMPVLVAPVPISGWRTPKPSPGWRRGPRRPGR